MTEKRPMATVHRLRPRAPRRLVLAPRVARATPTTCQVVDFASAQRRSARRHTNFDFDTSPGGNAA